MKNDAAIRQAAAENIRMTRSYYRMQTIQHDGTFARPKDRDLYRDLMDLLLKRVRRIQKRHPKPGAKP